MMIVVGDKRNSEQYKIDRKLMETKQQVHMTVMKHKGRFNKFKREYINTLKQLEINKKKYK